MKLVPCKECEATHVQVLPDEYNHYKLMGVTPYAIYKVIYNDEDEEMLQNDKGEYCCSFSLVVKVKWMKLLS